MRIKNYVNYGMCIYESTVTGKDAYQLGDVVINKDNEIGVVIQVHSAEEFRTDMFGNSSANEVRLASDDEIKMYRPLIEQEGKFDHENPRYIAVRSKSRSGINETKVFNGKSGNVIAVFPSYVRQPRFGGKHVTINGWKHPISQWMKA